MQRFACLRIVALLGLVLFVFVGSALAGGKRVAFVVGNGAYVNVPALQNPKHDAEGVSQSLRKVGFEVVTAIDLDRPAFDKALEQFIRSLRGADISLFYYAGHGIEVGGDNRIIPVDAKLEVPADLEIETVSIKTIMLFMQSNSKAQLIYLDACRDNPFRQNAFLIGADEKALNAGKGLAAQPGSVGSLVAYATEPGSVALDGDGKNSPFTEAVLRHSFIENVDVQQSLMLVTQDVWKATNKKQRPWSNVTLVEPVFLNGLLVKNEGPTVEVDAQTKKVKDLSAVASVVHGKNVTLGAGEQPLLDQAALGETSAAVKVTISKLPESGTLTLAGEVLAEGAQIDVGLMADVKFEPAPVVGSGKARVELALMSSDGKATPLVAESDVVLNPCDAHAAEPLDLQGTSKGLLPNEIDPESAIAACKAAAADYPDVPRFLYQWGRAELANKNIDEANRLFALAEEAGHIRAIYQLGYNAQHGVGVAVDLAAANARFKTAAERGDPYGLLAYGRNLVRGRGVESDIKLGMVYLNRAVEMGHTYAMNELGALYSGSDFVKANPKRAVRFYEASMARGDIYGIRNMGLAYLNGNGVDKDPATALALFKRASDGGHPSAPTDIGILYFNGKGVAKDLDEAVKWYELGAERGSVAAAKNLGWIFSNGPKDHRDLAKAVRYTALAAGLDVFDREKDLRSLLAAFPDKAKSNAVKHLIKTVGPDGVETASNLDETLILLSRKAWMKRNPRFDLF